MLMYYINLEKLLNNPSYDLEIMLSDATKALVNAVLRLLSRDGQGNIKASRVLQLRKKAEDSGDERFLDEIRHLDMWNRNVEFIEEEMAWDRPAVFVEILPIRWRCVAPGREYRCEPEVALHIVTDWIEASGGEPGCGGMFDLPERIHEELCGLSGRDFHSLDLRESRTNHDHGEILEMIEVYGCYGSRIFG